MLEHLRNNLNEEKKGGVSLVSSILTMILSKPSAKDWLTGDYSEYAMHHVYAKLCSWSVQVEKKLKQFENLLEIKENLYPSIDFYDSIQKCRMHSKFKWAPRKKLQQCRKSRFWCTWFVDSAIKSILSMTFSSWTCINEFIFQLFTVYFQ